jgi:hypothetical protein
MSECHTNMIMLLTEAESDTPEVSVAIATACGAHLSVKMAVSAATAPLWSR